MTEPQDGLFPGVSGLPTIGALLVMAILAIGCRGAEVPSCAAGEPISVNLEDWRYEMNRSAVWRRAAPTYDTLLAEIGLAPIPDRTDEDPAADGLPMKLVSLKLAPLLRGGGVALDWLVAARFRDIAGAESLRAQLLRQLDGRSDTYCALGDDLSHDKESFEEPCLEPHDGPARSLTTENLIALHLDTIVVHDVGGWCGPGANRGDRRATSYWGVVDGRLVRHFEVVTFEAWYESPAPPEMTRHAEIDLSNGWPKVITVWEKVECQPAAGADGGDTECEPSTHVRQYRYVDNRYTELEEQSVIDFGPNANGSEETDL